MTRFQLVLPALLLAACGGGSTVIEPPPPPADELTLTLKADPEDATSAQALGWAAGIPETDVTLTPKAPATGAPQTHRTSAAGKIVIARLPAADYLVEARRILTDAERGRLAAGDDAVGFVVKSAVRVAAGGGQEVVSAPASRRRSLVISEFFNSYTHPTGNEPYFDGAYVELHNNSDTTIYLDGMILARGLAPAGDYPNFPCSLYAPHSGDPGGVWVRQMAQFPGTGRQFAVSAGGTIVVATDAIDHSVIAPGGPDLRAADFEMRGTADVDNPAVIDMIDQTVDGPVSPHGMNWPDDTHVTVLVLPIDVASLQRGESQPNGYVFARVPRERVLDVLSFHTTYPGPYPNCPSMVHSNFDRAMGFLLLGDEYSFSRQRRVAANLPTGLRLLQHSRSSEVDFIAATRSPGAIP